MPSPCLHLLRNLHGTLFPALAILLPSDVNIASEEKGPGCLPVSLGRGGNPPDMPPPPGNEPGREKDAGIAKVGSPRCRR